MSGILDPKKLEAIERAKQNPRMGQPSPAPEDYIKADLRVHAGILTGEPRRPDFHRGVMRGLALALRYLDDPRDVETIEREEGTNRAEA